MCWLLGELYNTCHFLFCCDIRPALPVLEDSGLQIKTVRRLHVCAVKSMNNVWCGERGGRISEILMNIISSGDGRPIRDLVAMSRQDCSGFNFITVWMTEIAARVFHASGSRTQFNKTHGAERTNKLLCLFLSYFECFTQLKKMTSIQKDEVFNVLSLCSEFYLGRYWSTGSIALWNRRTYGFSMWRKTSTMDWCFITCCVS